MNVTTIEDKKLTIELSSLGFHIVCDGKHNAVEEFDAQGFMVELEHQNYDKELNIKYFETPYSLLSSVSDGYNGSFAKDLTSKLKEIQN